MRRGLRRHPILVSAVATAIAAAAVLVIAEVTGADAVGRAFSSMQPAWIALTAVASIATYPAYALAYRSVARVHGHPPLELPVVARVVAAGFGPFHVAGGFGVDKDVLHAYAGAEPGEVRVFAERVGQRVVIVVEDDGAGLSPRADSPGLGLGLMVISEVALDFHVGAGERGVGTRVELSFAVAG